MILKYRYQSYSDLSTQVDNITMITIYAGGVDALKRAMPHFLAYKYFKLGPVEAKLVPASTLPVDPTGLSYEAGVNNVDPRDQTTPGIVRITNGEDFHTAITGKSAYEQRAVYNAMMLDPRWFKWSLQSGLRKWAVPKYWLVGQVRQDYYPGATINVPQTDADGTLNSYNSTATLQLVDHYDPSGDPKNTMDYWAGANHTAGRGLLQLGEHGTVGWLPTDSNILLGSKGDGAIGTEVVPNPNAVPQIELFRILLPPAFKTRYYYRLYVTETIYFRSPVIQNPEYWEHAKFPPAKEGDPPIYKWVKCNKAPLDRFIRCASVNPSSPFDDVEPGIGVKPKIKNNASNNKENIEKSSDQHPDQPERTEENDASNN